MARERSSIPFTADGWVVSVTVRETEQAPRVAWEAVIAVLPDLTSEDRDLALREPHVVRKPVAYKAGFHISPALRVVAVQGGWWYRGVTAVEPSGDGARLTHIVLNIAPGWTRWIAHLVQVRQYRARNHDLTAN